MNINSSHKVFLGLTIYLTLIMTKDLLILIFNLSLVPKKGTLLIFPADWTHIHRENVMKKMKNIFTWKLSFPDTLQELEKIISYNKSILLIKLKNNTQSN